jgi:hypothetical protein
MFEKAILHVALHKTGSSFNSSYTCRLVKNKIRKGSHLG